MGEGLFKCPRCGSEGEYYSTGKTLCPVTRKVVCDACAEAAQERASPKAFTHFGGATYDPARDYERLGPQQLAVNRFMADLKWHTPTEIMASGIKGTDSSITARIRDIRKEFPAHAAVERRRKPGAESSGINEYRVTIPAEWLLRWGSKRSAA